MEFAVTAYKTFRENFTLTVRIRMNRAPYSYGAHQDESSSVFTTAFADVNETFLGDSFSTPHSYIISDNPSNTRRAWSQWESFFG